MTAIHPQTQARLDWLAAQDIGVSLVYGPSGGHGVIWSVNCMSPNGGTFARPQQADNFDHAVEVAVLHSIKLGFVEGEGAPHVS